MWMRGRTILAVVVLVAAACGSDGDGVDAGAPPPDEPAASEEQDGRDAGREDDRGGGADDGEGDGTGVPAGVGEDAWTTLTEAPLALSEVGVAAFDGELWVAGGLSGDGGVTPTVQVYDPAADRWRDGPELPEPVHHASLVATDSELVLMGGYRTLAFDPVADVFVLDQANDAWVEAPDLPEARGAGAGAWDGERLVFAGGVGPDGLADDVWALDDVTGGQWSETGQLSIARDHLAATSAGDGNVWFLAGRENSLVANLGTVDLLSGDRIEPIGEMPTPRGGVGAFSSQRHGACVAGGEQPDGTFAEVECITADGETTSLPGLSSPRHGVGAAAIAGVAYVALGGPDPGLAVSGTLEALRVDQ